MNKFDWTLFMQCQTVNDKRTTACEVAVSDYDQYQLEDIEAQAALDVTEKVPWDTDPNLKDVKSAVFLTTLAAYAMYNRKCDERGAKAEKVRPPQGLTPEQGAIIMSKAYEARLIMMTDDPSESVLGLYDKGEGIYVTGTQAIGNMIARVFPRSTSKWRRECASIIQAQAKAVKTEDNADLIPVHNGIFNYITKELEPFSPDHVFLAKAAIDYNETAQNVVIHNDEDGTDWDVESWMQDLTDDDTVTVLLWEGIGAALRPRVSWDKALFLYSDKGSNGKGTYCQILRSILGPGTWAGISLKGLNDRFRLSQLVHAQAIINDENDVGDYQQANAVFKALITHDAVNVDRKFDSAVTISWHGFMVQCVNDLPSGRDKSGSYYRRIIPIPFSKSFRGKTERRYIKHDYLQRADVLEYVLKKVLKDMPSYYALDEPAACMDLLDDIRTANDSIKMFYKEIFPQFTWDILPGDFVYDVYKAWSMDAGYGKSAVPNRRNFLDALGKTVLEDGGFWTYDETGRHKGTKGMEKAETLIYEYNLTYKWGNRAQQYRGAGMTAVCTPDKNVTDKQHRYCFIRRKPQEVCA